MKYGLLTTFLATGVMMASPCHASTCSDQLYALSSKISAIQQKAQGDVPVEHAESTKAMRHEQPTQGSLDASLDGAGPSGNVAKLLSTYQDALDNDLMGETKQCNAKLAEVRKMLDDHERR